MPSEQPSKNNREKPIPKIKSNTTASEEEIKKHEKNPKERDISQREKYSNALKVLIACIIAVTFITLISLFTTKDTNIIEKFLTIMNTIMSLVCGYLFANEVKND